MKPMADPAQKEDIRHGAYVFPFQAYHTTLDSLHPSVGAHWHEEAEFTLVKNGSCRYHLGLEERIVHAGDLLFVPPLMLHSASLCDSPQTMESETFVFHLNFLGANLADVCSIRYLTPLSNQELVLPSFISPSHPSYQKLYEVFQEMGVTFKTAAPGYELEIKSLLFKLLFLLVSSQERQGTAPPLSQAGTEKIRNVLTYIEEHYPEPLSIDELCGLCYLSKYHFMRFFRQHVGMTCVEYINHLRLEKAAELFEQGNSSILDVSLSVGFNNLSYFHRAFLKKYHVTPGAFMKLQREKQGFQP